MQYLFEKCSLPCCTARLHRISKTAHGHKLFYYDQRKQGEVDYLIDNYTAMSPYPIEVKSGKDYTVHSALNNLLGNPDYHIPSATVVSNEREIRQDGKVTYMPVYLVMFMESDASRRNTKDSLLYFQIESFRRPTHVNIKEYHINKLIILF